MCSCYRSIKNSVMSIGWGTTININITIGQLQIHLCIPSLSKFMQAIIMVRFEWSRHAVSEQPKQKRKYMWQLAGCRNRVVKSGSRLNLSQNTIAQAILSHNQRKHLRYERSRTSAASRMHRNERNLHQLLCLVFM